jgi:hypothetical protein
MPEYPGGFYGLGEFVSGRKKGIKEKAFFEGKDLIRKCFVGIYR